MTSTLRIARPPKPPAVPLDPDEWDRLDRQVRLLDLSLEGLYALGEHGAIEQQDISLLISAVMDIQSTLARLRAPLGRR